MFNSSERASSFSPLQSKYLIQTFVDFNLFIRFLLGEDLLNSTTTTTTTTTLRLLLSTIYLLFTACYLSSRYKVTELGLLEGRTRTLHCSLHSESRTALPAPLYAGVRLIDINMQYQLFSLAALAVAYTYAQEDSTASGSSDAAELFVQSLSHLLLPSPSPFHTARKNEQEKKKEKQELKTNFISYPQNTQPLRRLRPPNRPSILPHQRSPHQLSRRLLPTRFGIRSRRNSCVVYGAADSCANVFDSCVCECYGDHVYCWNWCVVDYYSCCHSYCYSYCFFCWW